MDEKTLTEPVKKFFFDLNDFDEEALRRKAALARKPTFSQEEMEASRQTGYAAGRIDGMKEAIGSQEAQIRDLVQQVVMTTDRIAADEADRMATFIDQAALIAVQALSKTLPTLLDLLAVDQIAAFVNGVLEEQVKAQTLNIYVAPEREDNVRERLTAMAESKRRKQAWVITPDPSLGPLQCRIEWTGGGADWDPNAVASTLLQTIVSHLPEHLRIQAMGPEVTPEAAPEPTPEAVVDDSAQKPHTNEVP